MINKFYHEHREQVKAAFSEKKDFPHVFLFDFLDKKVFASLRKEILSLSLSREEKPMFHRYSSSNLSSALQQKLFSREVISFLNMVLGRKIIVGRACVYSFSQKDYTLLNDSYTEKPGVDIIFDLTAGWVPAWGGTITYINGTGDALKLPSRQNSLILVRRQKNSQRFVKYVNHNAGKKKKVFVLWKV